MSRESELLAEALRRFAKGGQESIAFKHATKFDSAGCVHVDEGDDVYRLLEQHAIPAPGDTVACLLSATGERYAYTHRVQSMNVTHDEVGEDWMWIIYDADYDLPKTYVESYHQTERVMNLQLAKWGLKSRSIKQQQSLQNVIALSGEWFYKVDSRIHQDFVLESGWAGFTTGSVQKRVLDFVVSNNVLYLAIYYQRRGTIACYGSFYGGVNVMPFIADHGVVRVLQIDLTKLDTSAAVTGEQNVVLLNSMESGTLPLRAFEEWYPDVASHFNFTTANGYAAEDVLLPQLSGVAEFTRYNRQDVYAAGLQLTDTGVVLSVAHSMRIVGGRLIENLHTVQDSVDLIMANTSNDAEAGKNIKNVFYLPGQPYYGAFDARFPYVLYPRMLVTHLHFDDTEPDVLYDDLSTADACSASRIQGVGQMVTISGLDTHFRREVTGYQHGVCFASSRFAVMVRYNDPEGAKTVALIHGELQSSDANVPTRTAVTGADFIVIIRDLETGSDLNIPIADRPALRPLAIDTRGDYSCIILACREEENTPAQLRCVVFDNATLTMTAVNFDVEVTNARVMVRETQDTTSEFRFVLVYDSLSDPTNNRAYSLTAQTDGSVTMGTYTGNTPTSERQGDEVFELSSACDIMTNGPEPVLNRYLWCWPDTMTKI